MADKKVELEEIFTHAVDLPGGGHLDCISEPDNDDEDKDQDTDDETVASS